MTQNMPTYETPYVWAREFLEESGFNLTERMPALLGVYKVPGVKYVDDVGAPRFRYAVPPQLIHELSVQWIGTLLAGVVGFFVSAVRGIGFADVAWLLFVGFLMASLYLFRETVMPVVLGLWKELGEDVADFVQRHFFTATIQPKRQQQQQPPTTTPSFEIPPGVIIISAEDMRQLNTSADAIQRRINFLRMSKMNYVRSRTGIVYNYNTSRKLQAQVAKAQKALTDERVGHQSTKDFLEHQSNARADAEIMVDELTTTLDEVLEQKAEIEKETIEEETGEESPADNEDKVSNLSAQVERLQTQLEVEQASAGKLKKELENLEADFKVVEGSRDWWKETYEAMEQQSDDKATRALRLKIETDKAWNERRISRLENELEVEFEAREKAQATVRELREKCEKLDDDVDEARAAYNNLAAAYHVFGSEDGDGDDEFYPRPVEGDDDLSGLKADLARVQADLDGMDGQDKAEVDAKAKWRARLDELEAQDEAKPDAETTEPVQGESWRTYKFACQHPPLPMIPRPALPPLRRVQSAPLWLPLPHHGDTFDPLYDVSDYGDDDGDDEGGNEAPDKGQGDRDAKHDSEDGRTDNDANGKGDDEGDDDNGDDGHAGGAEKVATDAATPGKSSSRASSSLNGAVPEFVPSVRSSSSVPLVLPAHAPTPKASGPEDVRNPHIQKLNQEVKRLEWRRKSGMPDSAEEEEGHAGPEDVLGESFSFMCSA